MEWLRYVVEFVAISRNFVVVRISKGHQQIIMRDRRVRSKGAILMGKIQIRSIYI
jgi:hypothetical protein